jgi:tRNA(fMet)-specific endonuclease VapC
MGREPAPKKLTRASEYPGARYCQAAAAFESLPFDDAAASWYAIICAQLRREGRPIVGNDMLIASIAMSRDVALMTRNDRECRRVAGLQLISW